MPACNDSLDRQANVGLQLRGMRRASERGGVLIVAMVVLVALLGLGALTILAVTSSSRASSHERFQSIALYAAESGLWAGIDYLRGSPDWSADLASNPNASIPGNGAPPGDPGSLLSADLGAWYEVEVLNNVGDDGPGDTDGILLLRSTGHGPNGARVVVEIEVQDGPPISGPPPPPRPPLRTRAWRQIL
jgi:hypothetical protein